MEGRIKLRGRTFHKVVQSGTTDDWYFKRFHPSNYFDGLFNLSENSQSFQLGPDQKQYSELYG